DERTGKRCLLASDEIGHERGEALAAVFKIEEYYPGVAHKGEEPNGIGEILAGWASETPCAEAIVSPGREPLAYANLHRQIASTSGALRARGIRRNDRVAIVVPNGPEMATAFLGVSAAATSAPLNPSYKAEEFSFYLTDLSARALVIDLALDSPAREVATRLGIPVIELAPGVAAGTFTFGGTFGQDQPVEPTRADDVALVLHTSGTTSRPKQVTLTHANICASAAHICAALALGPSDRCLNVMPLFHIHGLMAAVLSSLTAGGSVVCAPALQVPRFFDWMAEFRPTWYTAVPTMHHAVLTSGAGRGELAHSSLRFIRSSSSALPRQTLVGLEKLFNVPVIEAYGMTEAAHQMTSNPLPPCERRPGSVGVAAGPDVAIMDSRGALLPAGATGEVVIRGPNVTAGCAGNPDANAAEFTNGWLRTGDQGSLDADGYLFLQGRLKELINRGGEKVSPLEIDAVLMDHPDVEQALAFAIPHSSLGEEVAAVVVLREPGTVTERELRNFASTRLADFKTPRRIIFVDAIPKGVTGKPQRIGLAERLGIGVMRASGRNADHVAPRDAVEEIIAAIWAEVLRSDAPGVHDNFFDAGGDSINAMQLVGRVRDALSVQLNVADFFEAPTVAETAASIAPQLKSVVQGQSSELLW
ncbi:MAG TPA: AMP-binding protein, partial [Gemmatimonadaceae bacterium]